MPEDGPARWMPDRTRKLPAWQVPRLWSAVGRGARGVCPACGTARLFSGYLKVTERCASCAAPLGQARADDAPPYFTIMVVGHLIIPAMLIVERVWTPELWVHSLLWVPLSAALAIGLLRPIKGMTVGVMTAMGMLTADGPG